MPPRTLISAEELLARLDAPRLRLFDCRFDLGRPDAGRQRYAEAHLPGAIHADLNRELSAPPSRERGRHPLPAVPEFEARLRAWGVNVDSEVVACDDGDGLYAARMWWMLRWLGHDDVAVLAGGMRRWERLGLPLSGRVPAHPPGNWVARPRMRFVVDATEVAAAMDDPSVRILDARAPERYRGEVEPIDARAGHVPGARNHPFTSSLDAQGRMLPPDATGAGFTASLAGVPSERTIAMCGSGVSACHLLLALEHAGLRGARLYPGSWSEWTGDANRPVRTGAEP